MVTVMHAKRINVSAPVQIKNGAEAEIIVQALFGCYFFIKIICCNAVSFI